MKTCVRAAVTLLAASLVLPVAGCQQREVDLKEGRVGALRLGMPAAEAGRAFGPPEIADPDFISWRGGKITAHVVGGRVETIRIADPEVALGGFRVGDPLAKAQQALPGGHLDLGEHPSYELPGQAHAWLEVLPLEEKAVTAFVMSAREMPGEEEEH